MIKSKYLILLSFCLLNCSKKDSNDTLFISISSEESGLDFENELSQQSDQNIIEYLYFYNGGGVAIGDINNDGLADIYLNANQKQDRLYLNESNLRFRDITEEAGFSTTENSWSTGVTMADINADGFLDIYVCNVGGYKSFQGHNQLYINNGDLTFSESSESYGLDFSGFSTQASFFDYDQDGDLDMYLLNHAVHTPRSYRPAESRNSYDPKSGDRLYRNEISEGRQYFTDVTTQAGIYSSPLGYGLGLLTSDINDDGLTDIYVGNDFHENDYLYINQGNGTFKESLDDYVHHTSRFSMGVDIADVNGDQLVDIFTLDMLPRDNKILLKSGGEDNNQVAEIKLSFGYDYQYARNTFQVNRGDNSFAELAFLTDTHATDWSWSVLMEDYDNDGLTDIYIANGIFKRPNDLDYINFLSNIKVGDYEDDYALTKELVDRMPSVKLSNYLFRNKGDLEFENVSESFGLSEPTFSNGAAYADLDNDGDLELVVNNVNEKAQLFKNRSRELNQLNFISIDLAGDSLNQFGIGSKATIFSGKKTWTRQVTNTRGFLSSVPSTINVGLGAVNQIDSILIRWPDGKNQVVIDIPVNERLLIKKDAGKREKLNISKKAENLSTLPFQHQEDQHNDYDFEHLIPHKLSTEGPAAAVGDVNGDGLLDIFLGGAHGQPSSLFVKVQNGDWRKTQNTTFGQDDIYEDVDASFSDLDKDGDLDLYVVSGGNKYEQGTQLLEDRIYLNNGNGLFARLEISLPKTNGACVTISDYNLDGDPDIFVGSRSVPGSYGVTPKSMLMTFRDGTVELIEQWEMGMVTDAEWMDYNNDSYPDLIIVGEWMPITVYKNQAGIEFENVTSSLGLAKTNGWWNSMQIADLNNDGNLDLVAGNQGLNSKLKASKENPVSLYLDDFDKNGRLDPLIFYYVNGTNIPLASKNDIIKQLPHLKKKFLSYARFAEVESIEELTEREPEIEKNAYMFKSTIFLNQKDSFKAIELPPRAQWSPVQSSWVGDINNDGMKDLVVVGNFFGSLAQLGRMDAMSGLVLLNKGEGKFQFENWLPIEKKWEYRHILSADQDLLFIPNGEQPIKIPLNSLRDISD